MKHIVKTGLIVLFLSVYCYAIQNISKSYITVQFENTQASEQHTYFTSLASYLLFHVPQSEISMQSMFPVSSNKTNGNKNLLQCKLTEQLFFIRFIKNSDSTILFEISQKKIDFLYPAHYFL